MKSLRAVYFLCWLRLKNKAGKSIIIFVTYTGIKQGTCALFYKLQGTTSIQPLSRTGFNSVWVFNKFIHLLIVVYYMSNQFNERLIFLIFWGKNFNCVVIKLYFTVKTKMFFLINYSDIVDIVYRLSICKFSRMINNVCAISNFKNRMF